MKITCLHNHSEVPVHARSDIMLEELLQEIRNTIKLEELLLNRVSRDRTLQLRD